MGRINWLIFVLLSETLLVKWTVGQYYRIPCRTQENCDHENTHLSCLKSPAGIKICECRHGETLLHGECTGNMGAACEVDGKRKCTSGAFCNPGEFGGGQCQCLPGYLENDVLKICEKAPENPFQHPCDKSTGEEFCKTESTGLHCLKLPGRKAYACSCRGTSVFDKNTLRCRLPVGAVCKVQSAMNPSPIECDGAAKCISSDNSPFGVCAYGVTMETQNLVNRGQYDGRCDRQNGEIQCDTMNTGLKCLKIPDRNEYACRCRNGGVFDETVRKCRLGIGQTCEISAGGAILECISSATCVLMDKAGGSLVGVCTEKRDMSMEVHSHTKEMLFNKTCREDHDCHHHETHLKCLLHSGEKKLCQCRHNSVFDLNDKVCYHGVGNRCELPSYRHKNPQSCLRGRADCVPDAEAAFVGTCVCRKDQDCHSHKSLPKTAPSVSSIYSNACQMGSYLFLLSICHAMLVFLK